jgi:hypothetical protein
MPEEEQKSSFLRDTYLFLKSVLTGKKHVNPQLGASLEAERKRRKKQKEQIEAIDK